MRVSLTTGGLVIYLDDHEVSNFSKCKVIAEFDGNSLIVSKCFDGYSASNSNGQWKIAICNVKPNSNRDLFGPIEIDFQFDKIIELPKKSDRPIPQPYRLTEDEFYPIAVDCFVDRLLSLKNDSNIDANKAIYHVRELSKNMPIPRGSLLEAAKRAGITGKVNRFEWS